MTQEARPWLESTRLVQPRRRHMPGPPPGHRHACRIAGPGLQARTVDRRHPADVGRPPGGRVDEHRAYQPGGATRPGAQEVQRREGERHQPDSRQGAQAGRQGHHRRSVISSEWGGGPRLRPPPHHDRERNCHCADRHSDPESWRNECERDRPGVAGRQHDRRPSAGRISDGGPDAGGPPGGEVLIQHDPRRLPPHYHQGLDAVGREILTKERDRDPRSGSRRGPAGPSAPPAAAHSSEAARGRPTSNRA